MCMENNAVRKDKINVGCSIEKPTEKILFKNCDVRHIHQ